MSATGAIVATSVGFVALLLGKVALDLMSRELQGQVAQLPHRILKLAARRLPSSLYARYLDEWGIELDYILDRYDARPVTRLARGLAYAFCLLRGASAIRRDHKVVNSGVAKKPKTAVFSIREIFSHPRLSVFFRS
ncbi:MAG: hypothetical protein LC808_37150 [Actinobacteria bacterium]|nr:hypothetical protein [Actinomycetota bacterium]